MSTKIFLPLTVELDAQEAGTVRKWLTRHDKPDGARCESFRYSVLENIPERWGEVLQYVIISIFPPQAAVRCSCGAQVDLPDSG